MTAPAAETAVTWIMPEMTLQEPVRALLVGKYENDQHLVQEIFQRRGWRLWQASDCQRALHQLGEHPVQVVLAETDLPEGDWRQLLEDLDGLPEPPQLVVTSRTADDYLWAEVLNVGGFDVLPQPLARDEAERVIESACRRPRRRPAGTASSQSRLQATASQRAVS